MNKKVIVLFAIICACLLLANSVSAKEDVKIKIDADDKYALDGGYIEIKLLNSNGKKISTKGTIHYTVTDSDGHYKWKYQPYKGPIRLRYASGSYDVEVKFDGDSRYNSAEKTQSVSLKGHPSSFPSFNPYTYYDNHNWGLNQKVDDYIEDNYWDEEIYDDASTYDGEGY